MEVIYLEIDSATNADPSAGIATFTGMASANPDLKAAFLDHGNVTSTAQAYLEAAGIAPEPTRDPAIEAELRNNYRLAGQLGATGTPLFVVGDRVMNAAVGYEALKKAIADAREKG